jgi:hypothetical protein
VLSSGLLWNPLPLDMVCGSGATCWRRLVRRQHAGVWRRLRVVILTERRRRGDLDLAGGNVTEPYHRRKAGSKHHVLTDANPDSAGRTVNGGQPQRHQETPWPGRRCVSRDRRPPRPAVLSPGQRAGRSRLRLRTPPPGAAGSAASLPPWLAATGSLGASSVAPTEWSNARSRGCTALLSERGLRTSTLCPRSAPHPGLCLGVLVL